MGRKSRSKRDRRGLTAKLLVADATSLRMQKLLARERTRTWLVPREEVVRAVFGDSRRRTSLTPEETVARMQALMAEAERRIAELCSSESRQFWLHVTRRIPPDYKVYGVVMGTGWLARMTLNLAIHRDGQATGRRFVTATMESVARWVDASDDAVLPEGLGSGLLPERLATRDVVRAYQMEGLAYLYCQAASGLRRSWKGGHLQIEDDLSLHVQLDDETEWLVQLYDERHMRYQNLSSRFGALSEHGSLAAAAINANNIPLLMPTPNLERSDVSEFIPGFAAGFYSNFLLAPANIGPWLASARLFEDEFRSAWSIRPSEVAATLSTLSIPAFARIGTDPAYHAHLMQRGYLLFRDLDEVANGHAHLFGEVMKLITGDVPADPASSMRAGLESLTYTESALTRIDLHTLGGARLIWKGEEGWICDLTLAPLLLQDLLLKLGIRGDAAANRKGHGFEDQAHELIRSRQPQVAFWSAPRKLKFIDGTEAEWDIAVVVHNILFLGESKSNLVTAGFERGTPEDLWEREQKVRAALRSIDAKALRVAGEPVGRNYRVPDNVEAVVPIVISAFAEYIPSREPFYFVDVLLTTPRVMVPEELAQFLSEPSGAIAGANTVKVVR